MDGLSEDLEQSDTETRDNSCRQSRQEGCSFNRARGQSDHAAVTEAEESANKSVCAWSCVEWRLPIPMCRRRGACGRRVKLSAVVEGGGGIL